MSDLIRAGESIARLAMQYEDMVLASKVITEIGSLEQHLTELRSTRDTLLEKHRNIRAQTDKEVLDFEALKAGHVEALEAVKCEAGKCKEKSEAEALAILTSAQESASQIVALATNDAVAVHSSQEKAVEEAQKEIAMLHTVRDQIQVDIVSLEESRKEALAKYDEILKTIKALSEPTLKA